MLKSFADFCIFSLTILFVLFALSCGSFADENEIESYMSECPEDQSVQRTLKMNLLQLQAGHGQLD